MSNEKIRGYIKATHISKHKKLNARKKVKLVEIMRTGLVSLGAVTVSGQVLAQGSTDPAQPAEAFVGLITLLIMLAVFFLPWIIAKGRGHRSSMAIFFTVLFLGWTGIGWLIAFIWSCSGDTEKNHRNHVVVIRDDSGSRDA